MKAGEKTKLVVEFLHQMGHYNVANRIKECLEHEEIMQGYAKTIENKNLEIMHLRNRIDELQAQVQFMRNTMERINGRETLTLENNRTSSFQRN